MSLPAWHNEEIGSWDDPDDTVDEDGIWSSGMSLFKFTPDDRDDSSEQDDMSLST